MEVGVRLPWIGLFCLLLCPTRMDNYSFHKFEDIIETHVFPAVDEALAKFNSDNGTTSWSLLRVTTFKETGKIPVCNSACWKTCTLSPSNFDYNLIFGNSSNDRQHTRDLSETIHKLCDELPEKGNYLVDIIWIIPSLTELSSLEKHVELLGCLMRLTRWHRGKITICLYENLTLPSSHHSTWACSLPLHFTAYPFIWDHVVIPHVIWRGDIRIVDSANTFAWLPGFQLMVSYNDDIRLLEEDNAYSKDDKAALKFLDGPITVITKIPLSTIPPYSLLDTRLKLVLPSCIPLTSALENSWKFVSLTNSETKMCYVSRIGVCSTSSPKAGPLGTTTWKQTIAAERFTSMGDFSQWEEVGHRLLVLVGDGENRPDEVSVFMLRNSEDYNFSTCRILSVKDNFDSTDTEESSPQSVKGIIDALPFFTSSCVKYLNDSCNDMQLKCIALMKEAFGHEIPNNHLMMLTKAITLRTFKCLSDLRGLCERPSTNNHECTLLNKKGRKNENLRDRENCPEKEYLIQRDGISRDRSSTGKSNSLSGILEVGFLKLDDMLERLYSSVEFTELLRNAQGKSTKHSRPSAPPFGNVANFGQDVYYNNTIDDELRQQKMNQLGLSYISHDTFSSFAQNSDLENVEQASVTSSVISGDKKAKENNKLLSCRGRSGEIKTTSSMILRNSVKKKPKNKKSIVQDELSRLDLKQLRIAVVDALEIHGIHLESPLFKTCAKKLFLICQTFAKDVIGEERTIGQFQRIAASHVKQVIKFETNLLPKGHRRR